MRTLSLLHRWAGGFLGLLLVALSLSGTVLLWEGAWVSLPGSGDSVSPNHTVMSGLADEAINAGARSITFAGEETGLHHVAFSDGAGAYYRQGGELVAHWATQWERPEWWIFDLHHHFFAGETGELVTGITGIAGLLFVVTGSILWWRSRRAFEWRLWPQRMQPGPIVRHHRDLGILVAPLLLISMTTGVLMIFEGARASIVEPFDGPRVTTTFEPNSKTGKVNVPAMLEAGATHYPDAAMRRLSFPRAPGEPYTLRMRQRHEWTPNGRTTLSFAADGTLLSIEAPARPEDGFMLSDALYPVHAAKVGGLVWKIALTLGGLALTILGALTTYSFWLRKARKRRGS